MVLLINSPLCVFKQITPAQVREAEKSLKIMEAMIEAMTPGIFFFSIIIIGLTFKR